MTSSIILRRMKSQDFRMILCGKSGGRHSSAAVLRCTSHHLLLFPDQFSWWWAFGINLFCFAVTQVFLYKFFSRFAKSQLAGVIVCIYWGLSLGGQSNVYFLRMYMMLTMFAVMYAYFSQTVLTAEGKIPLKQFIFVGLTTFLGALTQHNFLVFAFMYTLIQCVVLLIKSVLRTALHTAVLRLWAWDFPLWHSLRPLPICSPRKCTGQAR